jgi:excisionase family DNA binding protein
MLTRRFLTVKEVADLVQVSEASVRHWIRLQQLRAVDLGREWRIIPRDLEAFLAAHATSRAERPPADMGSGPPTLPASDPEAPPGLADSPSRPGPARRSRASGSATGAASRSKATRDGGA